MLLIDRALADQPDADEEAVAAAAEKATGIRPACSVSLDVGDGDTRDVGSITMRPSTATAVRQAASPLENVMLRDPGLAPP